MMVCAVWSECPVMSQIDKRSLPASRAWPCVGIEIGLDLRIGTLSHRTEIGLIRANHDHQAGSKRRGGAVDLAGGFRHAGEIADRGSNAVVETLFAFAEFV